MFVSTDKVMYSRRLNGGKQLHGTEMLMRSDLMESEPDKPGQLSKRVSEPLKGISRKEMTVGKTVKGKAVVKGKAKNADTILGHLLYDEYRRVWHFQLKRWKMPSAQSFGTKKLAAIAMGKCL